MTKQLIIKVLYNERDAAVLLGVSIYLLQRWRCYGGGPKFIRVGGKRGGAVRYRLSDLEEYLIANTVKPRVGATVS